MELPLGQSCRVAFALQLALGTVPHRLISLLLSAAGDASISAGASPVRNA